MAAVLRLLALLAVLASPATGLTYLWNGGNMGFSNSLNWQAGFAPIAPNNPCTTTFGGGNKTIISNLAASVYNVGRTLNLPADGTLLLANDGTVLNFADSTCGSNSQDAVWTGGLLPEQRNDFACHLNWLEDRSPNPSVTATTPPCAGDTLIFDDDNTYSVVIGPDVPLIAVGSIEVGPITITSNTTAQLSQTLPQINLISRSTVVFIGTDVRARTDVCSPMNLLQNDAAGRPVCICTSSCPTPDMLLSAQNRSLQASIAAANQLNAALGTYFVRTFTGTVTPAALSMTPTQFATALNNPSDPTNSGIAAAVAEALQGLPAASVSGVTVTVASNNATVTVTGTINATSGNLLPIGFSTLTPPNNIVWSSSTSAIPNNVTRTQVLVQSALGSKIFAVFAEIQQNRATTTTQQQPTPVQDVIGSILNTPRPADTVAAITGTTCLTTCGSDCAACQATLETALQSAGVTSPSTLAQQVVSLSGSGSNTLAPTLQIIQVVVDSTTASRAALNASAAVAARSYSLTAPPLYIGRSTTLATQLLSIASQNYATLTTTLANSITNFQGLGNISGFNATFVSTVPTAPSSASRRRRSGPQSPSAIAVNFQYTTSCLPGDTACQTAFTSSSPVGTLINRRLDDTFNMLALNLAYGQCISLVSGFDSPCLQQVGRSACSASLASTGNATIAQQDTYQAIFQLMRCGLQPSYPNGTCLINNPNAPSDASTQAIAVQCGVTTPSPATTTPVTNPPAAAAASSGGGGSIIPIAAGAGGGALLLVVIAVLLLRRKNNRTSAPKKVDDRTVVAFENPMYDDPAQNASQPVYDSSAHHDGEGLYDEPAFNRDAQKANPVYQSTEDLAAASEYMEQPGGGKGDGYLDVAPGAAEDVGYLDGVEKK